MNADARLTMQETRLDACQALITKWRSQVQPYSAFRVHNERNGASDQLAHCATELAEALAVISERNTA